MADPVGHIDLLPTILDALELPIPESLPGRSLLPAAVGKGAGPVATYFEALSGQIGRGWAPLYGVVEDGLKYVDLPIPELYELEADPDETRNLHSEDPAAVRALARTLEKYRALDHGTEVVEEDLETLQRLAALGYVSLPSVSAKSEYTADDDPKRLVDLDRLLQRVVALHRKGELAEALKVCQEVVARRPGMAVAQLQLAKLNGRLGHLREAIEAGREAVALSPTDVLPAILLAGYLSEAGELGEAAELLEPYAERPDPALEVVTARGAALAQLGETEAALAAFRLAREIDGTNALTLVQMATVHIAAGDHEAARHALDEAVVLDPSLALAHHQLGLLAVGRKDDSLAERHFRRALGLDPGGADTVLNLGLALARQGRRDEARPLLDRFVQIAPRRLYAGEIARVQKWLARTRQ